MKKTTSSITSCNNINIDEVLTFLPLVRACFPLKYLVLPLTPKRLRKMDFHPQIDMAVGKLSTWYGKKLT
jgi:hypothetical protein